MRVTSASNRQQLSADMSRNLTALRQVQAKISSGRQLNRPSDDPLNVVDALRLRAQMRTNQMHERAAGDAKGRLDAADATLEMVTVRTTRVRDLILTAANAATDAGGRTAIAAELDGIRQELIGLANTVIQGSSLFGGTSGTSQAFDPVTGNYTGTATAETRRIGAGDTIDVGVDGRSVFGPDGANLFQVIDQAAAAVRAGANLGPAMSAVDTAFETMRLAHADTGVRARRAEDTIDKLGQQGLSLREVLSRVEDTDLAEAAIELSSRQAAYEASLAVAGRTLQTSLLDYLR